MTPLREHLAKELATKVERHGIVVWDDPESAYRTVAAAVAPAGVALHAFDGSWFDLRQAVEGLLAGLEPPALVVYVPAKPVEPDPLEELRAVGTKWTIKLPTLIKQALAGQITEQRAVQLGQQCTTIGEAEAALAGGDCSLDARLIALAGDGSAVTVTTALVGGAKDAQIGEQGLEEVVCTTLSTSIGGDYRGMTGEALRRAALRQMVLAWLFDVAGSLHDDLEASIASTTAAQRRLAADVVRRLRTAPETRAAYVELANAIDTELHLGALLRWSDSLERFDATGTVEAVALAEGLRRLQEGEFEAAAALALTRLASSWWTGADAPVGDTAIRWRAIDSLARLESAVARTPAAGGTLQDVLAWYMATGWSVDSAFRQAELLRVTSGVVIDELDDLFQSARHRYEQWLDDVLRSATDALAHPDLSSERLQRTVHRHRVRTGPKPTAYVLVDALRYELGVELVERLRALPADVEIGSAIGTPPTITPVGMAALLPGADTSFTVELDAKERLVTSIAVTPIRSVKERVQQLEHAHGAVADLVLDDVAQYSNKELKKRIAGAALVLVRSTEIDAEGEGDQLATSWGGFANTLSVLHTAVAKLLHAGVRRVVLTADHGFLAVRQLGEERRIDKPATGTGEQHRRAWIGRGGTASPSTVKVPLAAFGIGGDLEIIVPRGLGVFTAGGGLQFFHGGLSPQELLVPVITVEAAGQTTEPQYQIGLAVAGGRISTGVLAVTLTMTGDLFTRESRVRIQLVQRRTIVGTVVGGDGFDPDSASIAATVDVPRVITLQVTANLVAGSTVTLEVLDVATGVRLGTLEVDVAANILVDDDLD